MKLTYYYLKVIKQYNFNLGDDNNEDDDNFNTPLVKKNKMNHAPQQHNESEEESNIVNITDKEDNNGKI